MPKDSFLGGQDSQLVPPCDGQPATSISGRAGSPGQKPMAKATGRPAGWGERGLQKDNTGRPRGWGILWQVPAPRLPSSRNWICLSAAEAPEVSHGVPGMPQGAECQKGLGTDPPWQPLHQAGTQEKNTSGHRPLPSPASRLPGLGEGPLLAPLLICRRVWGSQHLPRGFWEWISAGRPLHPRAKLGRGFWSATENLNGLPGRDVCRATLSSPHPTAFYFGVGLKGRSKAPPGSQWRSLPAVPGRQRPLKEVLTHPQRSGGTLCPSLREERSCKVGSSGGWALGGGVVWGRVYGMAGILLAFVLYSLIFIYSLSLRPPCLNPQREADQPDLSAALTSLPCSPSPPLQSPQLGQLEKKDSPMHP